jgi:hypothetical protein
MPVIPKVIHIAQPTSDCELRVVRRLFLLRRREGGAALDAPRSHVAAANGTGVHALINRRPARPTQPSEAHRRSAPSGNRVNRPPPTARIVGLVERTGIALSARSQGGCKVNVAAWPEGAPLRTALGSPHTGKSARCSMDRADRRRDLMTY